MRHQCAAVVGLLTVALLAPVSQSHAASADPTGYWKKPDAERESKIEVFKCGKKKTNLCAKIAWLKEPNDSKGQPLHDVRNENPALRGRQILGLPIFTDLVPSAPSTWNGKISEKYKTAFPDRVLPRARARAFLTSPRRG